MKSGFNSIFFLLFCCFLLISCKNQEIKVERAFYYWKNTAHNLNKEELNYLKTVQAQKLYVKFFEVETDKVYGAIPSAKSQLHIENYFEHDSALGKTLSNLEIIPTIFVKNEALRHPSKGSLDTLAKNVLFLINKQYKEKIKNSNSGYSEIQIDCDWTAKTKDNYFYLLEAIKKLSGKTISCTLRLYPYKYPDIMGVPPVNKVTLMCYNLISPLGNEDKNSILNNRELESYLRKAKKYPLHVDIALPVFSWMQIYQNNHFAGIINPGENEIKLKQTKPLWYEVQQDKETDNLYLREGDQIKSEEATAKMIEEAISMLKKHLSFDETITVTLFHLDNMNLKKYNNETLSRFYTDFNK